MRFKKFTRAKDCFPHNRCKNVRHCPLCRNQWAKKNMKVRLEHLDDSMINSFKYMLFVGVTINNMRLSVIEQFKLMEKYRKRLSSASGRRYKKYPLYESEYIIFREITYSSSTKTHMPHLHMIVLRNHTSPFDFNEPMELDFNIQEIVSAKVNDQRNFNDQLMVQSLKNIFIYCTKFDDAMLDFDIDTNLLKCTRDFLHSPMFSRNMQKDTKTAQPSLLQA